MRILTIASILPIPGLLKENDYVVRFIDHYLSVYPDNEFKVYRPVSYIPSFLVLFTKKRAYWRKKRQAVKSKAYRIQNIHVSILPYITIGSISSLFAFMSYLCWFLNRKVLLKEVRKAEVIHAHYLFPEGLLAYMLHKKYSIPYVLTLQNELRFFSSFLSNRMARRILSNAFGRTTLSPQMGERLNALGFSTSVFPLGIHERFFQPPTHSSQDDRVMFVTVANLVPVKNISSVINAISLLSSKDRITYHIIGDGPEGKKLEDMVSFQSLQNVVQFQGSVSNEELPEILCRYDVYIQPSYKESFGLSYFEALACGLPVILTKNTGAYYFLKGKEGIYPVDPEDVKEIASLMEYFILHKTEILNRREAIRKAARIADWKNTLPLFNALYNESRQTP